MLEPEIPHNTGAIGRSCVCTESRLHLIKPFGFNIDEKALRRAGLDYWKDVDVFYYENFSDFLEKNHNPKIYMATTKALFRYDNVNYEPDCFIMFGKESKGIPEEILLDYKETCLRIPMKKNMRSLNLANSVSIVLYEALRQNNFLSLETEGQLHNHKW